MDKVCSQAVLYSALGLAYMGDAVFELLVRARIMTQGGAPVNNLHGHAKAMVNAKAQAGMYMRIFDSLTDEEKTIIRRGRNAVSSSKSRNFTVSEYRHSTGLEALFGYLYLDGKHERLMEIFEMCMEENDG